jgi:hypothetical protein
MVDASGDVETDNMRGIEHMHVYKQRLSKGGHAAARSDYHAPEQPDVLYVVGGLLVSDSRQVSALRSVALHCTLGLPGCLLVCSFGCAYGHVHPASQGQIPKH